MTDEEYRLLSDRIIRLEAHQEVLRVTISAELKGYLDGQVMSLVNNHTQSYEALDKDIAGLRESLIGRKGDNGMRSLLYRQGIQIKVLIGAVVLLAGERGWAFLFPV